MEARTSLGFTSREPVEPAFVQEVGNQGEPGTDLGSKIWEPGGTGNRPEFKNWGTRGNRKPVLVPKVGNHGEPGTDFA